MWASKEKKKLLVVFFLLVLSITLYVFFFQWKTKTTFKKTLPINTLSFGKYECKTEETSILWLRELIVESEDFYLDKEILKDLIEIYNKKIGDNQKEYQTLMRLSNDKTMSIIPLELSKVEEDLSLEKKDDVLSESETEFSDIDIIDDVDCECQEHETGYIRTHISQVDNFNLNRTKCYGATSLPGMKYCHCDPTYRIPNYMNNLQQVSSRTLYNKTFHIITNAYVSTFTKEFLKRRTTERYSDKVDAITISSQGTWNRIKMLSRLAELWKGPISFCILLNEKEKEIEELTNFIQNDVNIQMFVDFHIVWRSDHKFNDSDAFYPINVLRNIGMQAVNSNYIFNLDIDVTPNAPHETYMKWLLKSLDSQKELERNQKVSCPDLIAFVPVAFEMTANNLNDFLEESEKTQKLNRISDVSRLPIHLPKKELIPKLLTGKAKPMHLYFSPAYGPTNHYEWMKDEKTSKIYYLTRFEPYYIAKRNIPSFHEEFVDRGGNFAEQVYEMDAGGYQFYRMPFAFVVDMIHEHVDTSEVKKDEIIENNTDQKVFKKNKVDQLWNKFYLLIKKRYNTLMPVCNSNYI